MTFLILVIFLSPFSCPLLSLPAEQAPNVLEFGLTPSKIVVEQWQWVGICGKGVVLEDLLEDG